jgi:hypothetical protein
VAARSVRRRANRLKKDITLSPEFRALWDRIEPKTTYPFGILPISDRVWVIPYLAIVAAELGAEGDHGQPHRDGGKGRPGGSAARASISPSGCRPRAG